jgi:hypothetical protein
MSFYITTKPGTGSGGALFTSSQVTTTSSAVTATSFTTFSNSPALSFTPTVTGTYKVYSGIPIEVTGIVGNGSARIFNTTGSATLLSESQSGFINNVATTSPMASIFTQSTYTLTAGTAYVFDIQGMVASSSDSILARGDLAAFYVYAELIPVSGAVGTPTVNGYAFKTSGTTFVTPANTTAATNFLFTLVGGGGGGGGVGNVATALGCGGGSGGVGRIQLNGFSASQTINLTIGAGGAGGTTSGSTGNNGSNGGDTTLTNPNGGTVYTASHGGGGSGSTAGNQAAGGTGGTTTNFGSGLSITGQIGGSNATQVAASTSGMGGSSGLGYGLGGMSLGGSLAGQAATGFGAGGGGAVDRGGNGFAGGNGTGGCIEILWWT